MKYFIALLTIFIFPINLLSQQTSKTKLYTYTASNLPKTNFILLRVNMTTMMACTTDGCFPIKLPGETIAPNYRLQYRLFNSYEITANASDKVILWDISKKSVTPVPLPWGKKKWKDYSVRARFILNDGTTIGDFMENGRKNLIYIANKKKKNKKLYQVNKYRASSNHLFQRDGSYIFVNAPGTGRTPTAPFANHVKGYYHTIFYGKSLNAKPQKICKRTALIRLGYFNNGKHIGFMRLGKYKWEKHRTIILETVTVKTKKSRIVSSLYENFKNKKTMWEPRVIYFNTLPYVIFETKPGVWSTSSPYHWVRNYKLINVETGKSIVIPLNGYQLTWAIDQHPALYDEVIYSKYIVLHKIKKTGADFKVLRIPDMKEVMKFSLKKPEVERFPYSSIFDTVLHGNYIDYITEK